MGHMDHDRPDDSNEPVGPSRVASMVIVTGGVAATGCVSATASPPATNVALMNLSTANLLVVVIAPAELRPAVPMESPG